MASHDILVAYTPTDEAADALALGRLLAERLGEELVVARVLPGAQPEIVDRAEQLDVRAAVADTRRSIVAVVPDGADVEIVPVVDASVARGLHDLARAEDAHAIVVGSTHHHAVGRILLGSVPETVANGAPCPVFVAPPGFREHPQLTPYRVGVAFDGTDPSRAALRYAVTLAERLGADLCVVAVRAPWISRPIGAPREVGAILAEGVALAKELSGGRIDVSTIEREGEPARELAAETDDGVGLLVLGSRGHGVLGRALLGSVSAAVVRAAHGPVVVAPHA